MAVKLLQMMGLQEKPFFPGDFAGPGHIRAVSF